MTDKLKITDPKREIHRILQAVDRLQTLLPIEESNVGSKLFAIYTSTVDLANKYGMLDTNSGE